MNSDQAVQCLGALAQSQRLAAFRMLVAAGPDGMAAGAVADALAIPASTLSFHLAQLAQAGLVTMQRAGRSIIYAADFAAMQRLMAYLSDNCCGGVDCGVNAKAVCP